MRAWPGGAEYPELAEHTDDAGDEQPGGDAEKERKIILHRECIDCISADRNHRSQREVKISPC